MTEIYPIGYLDASQDALDNLARDMERERQWGADATGARVIKHPSEIEAERRAYQAEAEAARKASDPRGVLRQAHILQAEAAAEVDRLAPLLERARHLVEDLEARRREQAAAVQAGALAAAERLLDALAAGTEPLPLNARTAALHDQVEATAAKITVAQAALSKLEAEAGAAGDRLNRCEAGVRRCSLEVMVDEAADLANEIIVADLDLRRRRADLDNLSRLLTIEHRRLNGTPPTLPAQINRAIYPADTQLIGADRGLVATDWRAEYAALIEGDLSNG